MKDTISAGCYVRLIASGPAGLGRLSSVGLMNYGYVGGLIPVTESIYKGGTEGEVKMPNGNLLHVSLNDVYSEYLKVYSSGDGALAMSYVDYRTNCATARDVTEHDAKTVFAHERERLAGTWELKRMRRQWRIVHKVLRVNRKVLQVDGVNYTIDNPDQPVQMIEFRDIADDRYVKNIGINGALRFFLNHEDELGDTD